MGRTRWILILCAWTIVGLLFTVQEIAVAKVHGGHVSWVLVGVIELVYWNVWAAFTPLVIALAKRFPLTGPRFVSHIAIHTITSFLMAPLASVTEYFLSHGLLRTPFSHNRSWCTTPSSDVHRQCCVDEPHWRAYVLVSCGTVSVDPLLPGRYGAPDSERRNWRRSSPTPNLRTLRASYIRTFCSTVFTPLES